MWNFQKQIQLNLSKNKSREAQLNLLKMEKDSCNMFKEI